jgi:hypothetical protein
MSDVMRPAGAPGGSPYPVRGCDFAVNTEIQKENKKGQSIQDGVCIDSSKQGIGGEKLYTKESMAKLGLTQPTETTGDITLNQDYNDGQNLHTTTLKKCDNGSYKLTIDSNKKQTVKILSEKEVAELLIDLTKNPEEPGELDVLIDGLFRGGALSVGLILLGASVSIPLITGSLIAGMALAAIYNSILTGDQEQKNRELMKQGLNAIINNKEIPNPTRWEAMDVLLSMDQVQPKNQTTYNDPMYDKIRESDPRRYPSKPSKLPQNDNAPTLCYAPAFSYDKSKVFEQPIIIGLTDNQKDRILELVREKGEI